MVASFKTAALGAALVMLLSGCGGESGGSSSTSGAAASSEGLVTLAPLAAVSQRQTDGDAARLAKQATFGPTPAVIDQIKALGVNGWIDSQFAATGSTYADIAANPVRRDLCADSDIICLRQHFSRAPVANRFYADAVQSPDQLRQRVAFALSQIIVASEQKVSAAAGIAAFNQILLSNAFGNYRDILAQVTLNGYMGTYLDLADSSRTAPSENYAREFIQLFSVGPNQLNMDGTPKLDASGAAIPTYTNDDIRGVARALTGWTYAHTDSTSDWQSRDYSKPMIAASAKYDTTAKTFFGKTVPAGASQQASVDAVVDAAFNNATTAPYISKLLISHLVTPNPTPAYVARVAAKFADNGKGVRGDLKEVVRAILTDTEARSAPGASAGKLKDPILLMTSLARVISFSTDGYVFMTRDNFLGQGAFRAPSVFSFYPPDYPLPGSSTLKSPASKLLDTSNAIRWHNFVYDWTVSGDAARTEYALDSGLPLATKTQPNWTAWSDLAATDLDAVAARIDLLMFANTLTQAQRDALKAAAQLVVNTDATTQSRRRAQTMLYIAASSPLFMVDR